MWLEFTIKDVFTLKPSKNREAAYYSAGKVRFVASGSTNNGVQKYISTTESLDSGNCITFSTIDCSSFYQEEDFIGRGYGALIEIRHPKLNKYNAMFLTTIFRKLSHKYDYNNQCWFNVFQHVKILLPATTVKGVLVPDWDFMERYIRDLPISSIL